jgi:hypothetical protein
MPWNKICNLEVEKILDQIGRGGGVEGGVEVTYTLAIGWCVGGRDEVGRWG